MKALVGVMMVIGGVVRVMARMVMRLIVVGRHRRGDMPVRWWRRASMGRGMHMVMRVMMEGRWSARCGRRRSGGMMRIMRVMSVLGMVIGGCVM